MTDELYEEVIIAGFGGQGIILAGKLLAQAAMKAGKQVTYMPAYGAEVRGGTANCMVIIADEPIASPLISNPNTIVALNKASLEKFGPMLKKDGLLIINSSLISEVPELTNKHDLLALPADELAVELGNQKCANMVALGAYLQKRGQIGTDIALQSLPDVLAQRYHKTIPINSQAMLKGAEFAKNN